jgi:outer membrane protein W
MVRSGAVALGAFLVLGGVTAAGAADISDLGSYISSLGGEVYPHMPENWSDLPFTVHVSQNLGYNSNILNTVGQTGGFSVGGIGKPVGSFVTTSSFGGSTRYYWGAQQFFLSGSYGVTRYIGHSSRDSNQNSLSAGMNWVLTSRCSGSLVYSQSTTPSTPGQQVSTNAINITSQKSLSETASCQISGNWSAVFNTGLTESTNTALLDRANNAQTAFVSAGITYTVSQTNTVQLLGTVSHVDFPDRGILLSTLVGAGLANNVQTSTTQQTVNLSYTKNVSPNLSLIASVGVSGSASGVANLGNTQSSFQPQFTLSASWTVTPKLSLSASVARVATPPTSIIANIQNNESLNVGMSYTVTPKIGFSMSAGINRSSNGNNAVTSQALQALFPNLSESTNYNFSTGLSYSITPFIGANLTYSYNRSVQPTQTIPTSSVMLAVNFSPH